MGILKKAAAAILVACFAVAALTSCHAQNEEVLDIAGTKISSSFYLAALLSADLEFQNEVSSSSSSASSNYKSQTLDDKPYETWVKDTALSNLKKYVYLKDELSKANVSFDDETRSNVEYATNYYWNYYGYEKICKDNGISEDDFSLNISVNYMSDMLFDYLYGEGGENEIDKDEVLKALDENYILADVINEDVSSASDDEKAEIKSKLEGYRDRLAAGESWDTILEEYNEENGTSSTSTSSASDEEGPEDKNAVVFGSENTNSPSDYFDDLSTAEIGVPQVMELDDYTVLILRKDITADDYYYDNYGINARYILKGDEFESTLDTESAKLEATELVNLDYYSPDKLVYDN